VDRLVVAFLSARVLARVTSELINAIFFADYGRRILSVFGRAPTRCPVPN